MRILHLVSSIFLLGPLLRRKIPISRMLSSYDLRFKYMFFFMEKDFFLKTRRLLYKSRILILIKPFSK